MSSDDPTRIYVILAGVSQIRVSTVPWIPRVQHPLYPMTRTTSDTSRLPVGPSRRRELRPSVYYTPHT